MQRQLDDTRLDDEMLSLQQLEARQIVNDRVGDRLPNEVGLITNAAAGVHMIDVATAPVAEQGNDVRPDGLAERSFDEEWVVGTPLHAADGVQM